MEDGIAEDEALLRSRGVHWEERSCVRQVCSAYKHVTAIPARVGDVPPSVAFKRSSPRSLNP